MAAAVTPISNAAIQAITDPQARAAVRAIADQLAVRNGDLGNGDQAFLTLADLSSNPKRAAALASALAAPIAAGVSKPGDPLQTVADQLQDSILGSAAWQEMYARIALIDAPDSQPGSVAWQLVQEAQQRGAAITTVQQSIQSVSQSLATTTTTLTAALNTNAAAIQTESTTRTTQNTAMAQQLSTVIASTAGNTAAMTTEVTARTNNDNALVQAINTMWARVGTNTALVQSGTTITVNNVGSQLTKLDTLQATVTNPVTGLVAQSAALQQQQTLTANTVSGMAGKWSVKLDLNGYISGVSLNSGVTTGGVAESSFIVSASTFAIGNPGTPTVVPFALDTKTGLLSLRGSLLATGTVQASALAAKTITAASGVIGDAAITNANIQNAAVGTLTVAGNAITFMAACSGGNIASVTITTTGGPVFLAGTGNVTLGQSAADNQGNIGLTIRRDGLIVSNNYMFVAPQGTITSVFVDYPVAGTHTYQFSAGPYSPYGSDGSITFSQTVYGIALETRR